MAGLYNDGRATSLLTSDLASRVSIISTFIQVDFSTTPVDGDRKESDTPLNRQDYTPKQSQVSPASQTRAAAT